MSMSLGLNIAITGQSGGGGGGPAPQTTEMIAANRTIWPTQTASVATNQGYAKEHWASPEGAISALVLTYVGWYINGTFTITDASTGSIKAFIEYPANTFTPVLFSGSTTGSIPAAGIVSSDPVAALSIPAGTRFWVHTIRVSGSAGNMALSEIPANASALSGITDTSYTYSGSGNPPARGAADASNVHLDPAVITGTIAAANASGFVITGDSIAFGQGNIGAVGAKGGSGFIGQGLDKRYPYTKWAKGGMTGVQLAALAANARIIALRDACKCTDVISEWGGGDLRDGWTVPQITTGYQTVYSLFPGKRIGQTTVIPRTDSSDGWATVANQTAKTDGNWADEIPLNTAIRAIPTGATYYIETSDAASSAHDSRKHAAPPVPNIDGVHPNDYTAARLGEVIYRDTLGHAAIAPSIPQTLTTYGIGQTTLGFSFVKPATGTDPITYLVEYKRTVDSVWTQFSTGTSALTGLITGLTASTSYDIRVTPTNGTAGPTATLTVSTVTSFQPLDLTTRLVSAFNANDATKTLADGSNNLTVVNDIYNSGSLVPLGATPTVITNGGAMGNKRVIDFPAASGLGGGGNAALLATMAGSSATTKGTFVEAIKYVAGATSRGFLFGKIGTSQNSFGERQTTSNRGLSVVEVAARAALTAFQSSFDANWHVHTFIKNGTSCVYRVDGVQVASLTLVGDGTWVFNEFLIGATPGTTTVGVPAAYNPADMYSAFVAVSDNLSGTELTNLEAWVGATAGL
ncbi:hypothetical protein [Rhizobium leguminosarum]